MVCPNRRAEQQLLCKSMYEFWYTKPNILPLLHEIISMQYLKVHDGFYSGINNKMGLEEKIILMW